MAPRLPDPAPFDSHPHIGVCSEVLLQRGCECVETAQGSRIEFELQSAEIAFQLGRIACACSHGCYGGLRQQPRQGNSGRRLAEIPRNAVQLGERVEQQGFASRLAMPHAGRTGRTPGPRRREMPRATPLPRNLLERFPAVRQNPLQQRHIH